MKQRIVVAVLALAGLAGCPSAIYETYDYGKEYDPRKHEYVVGVSDVISIVVYHTPDLSGTGTVRPDGVITLPLIGEVPVAGKTPTQIKAEVKKRVSEYLKTDAIINVTITGFNSYRFVVTGQITKSGVQTQKFYVTVSEAIAMAGGPNKFAGDQIVVFRKDENKKTREIPISYKMLTDGKHPDMDIAVVAGDNIILY